MSKTPETGDRAYIILHFNSYDELRCIMVSANTINEAEEISLARGIKPVGICSAKQIIVNYNKTKSRRKHDERKGTV